MHPQSSAYKLLVHQYRLMVRRMHVRLRAARWEALRQSLGRAGEGVHVELLQPRLMASVTPYGSAFLVNQSGGATVATPAVAEQPGGGFVTVWAEKNGSLDGSGWGIYGRLYQANGTASGSPFLVNQTTTGDQTLPSVAINAGGSFVVSWVSGSSVYARTFGPGGASPSAEHVVATGLLRSAAPEVGISTAGSAVLVYEGSGAGDSDGIYAQSIASDGTASGGALLVNTTTTGSQTSPARVNSSTGTTFSTGSGNAISVAGADSAINAERVTLGASHGTLADSGMSGLPLTSGADGSGAMTFTGSHANFNHANFNAALASVVYTPATNAAPTVATPASASPSPVTSGTTTVLSVIGADDGGESNLTYTWATTGAPPAAVSFSANGTNAAKNTVATFTKAGAYSFQVTITDAGGLSATSTVTATVNPTLTAIGVTPATATVNENAQQQFTATAYDQFGAALASQPPFTWAITSGGGSVSNAGFYTAPGAAGPATVTASSGGVSGGASAAVVDPTQPANNVIPGPQTTVENVSLVFFPANGNELAVGNNWPQVTLTASGGTVSLSTTAGLTLSSGTGQNDTSVAFTGTQTAMNAALNGLTFNPTPNTTGSASVQLYTYNPGILGILLASSSTSNVAITITAPANLPPVVSTPGPQATGVDAPLVFSAASGSAISVSDPDANGGAEQVTLTATGGTLTLSGTAGLTFSAGTGGTGGSGDVTMTFTGTLAAINTALNGLTFTPNPEFAGSGGVAVAVNDLANTGSGGAQTATASVAVTVVNAAPTVATPASASPSPVTAATATLSVLGADDGGEAGLTYAWATAGSPPAAVSFNANGTNAAKNVTATFTKAGIYNFQVTITDVQGASTTSTVSVTVQQTFTGVTVSPGSVNLQENQQQAFAATAYDQFGDPLATQPAFTWTVPDGFGAVSAAGVYTAPSSGLNGSATVSATAAGPGGTLGAAAAVTVSNPGPIITAAASASPSPVTGATTTLNVSANSAAPNGQITVTWSLLTEPAGAPTPAFSSNGNHGARSTDVTFAAPGDYSFRATVEDQTTGLTATSDVAVQVVLTFTSIDVSPPAPTLDIATAQQFTATALDQLGDPMATQPAFTWSASDGAITPAGAYTAPAAAGSQSVTATSGSVSGSADVTVANGTAAVASPNPVTGGAGNSTGLSVTGTRGSGLTYTWSAAAKPAGAADPAFSANGSTSASSTTATFSKAGTYALQVVISDGTTSSVDPVTVTVAQTVSRVTVAPASAALNENAQQPFTATAYDQFGDPFTTPPAFTWAVTAGAGSVDASGLYTAPGAGAAPASATVTATSGAFSASASVTVTNAAPTIATAAAATPSPVTGTTTTLSVLGADDGGEGNLTYTWSTTGSPPAPVSFSANGTNAAKTTTATFSAAGTYTFLVSATDAEGLSATASVAVMVGPSATSVLVSPAAVTLHNGATQSFSALAYDQFGSPMSPQPAFTWSVAGAGSIDASGLYTAPAIGGATATVTASTSSGGSVTASAAVRVNNAAPTVTAAASASPDPVTGTSTALSVGASTGGAPGQLVYTWSAPVLPSGAAGPTFSTNGTQGAANTTATFPAAGTYVLQATVTNTANGVSAVSDVTVQVLQTLTRIDVSPTAPTLALNAARRFTAVAYDQFGAPMSPQPGFTWAVAAGPGAVDGTGLYTAPGAPGAATVTATSGAVTGSASVTVVNTAPTIAAAPSASPDPVDAETASLDVAATDDGSDANLTYTWDAAGTPPGPVTFSDNGDNQASHVTATFSAAGAYDLRVTITDAGGLSATADVGVTVNAVLTTVTVVPVAPAPASLADDGREAFSATAYDQFGRALDAQPVFHWSVPPGQGSLDSSGVYSAPGSAFSGTVTLTASAASPALPGGSASGSATVVVVDAAPTVALPASASPPHAVGTSADLSVLGADDSGEDRLSYTWVVVGAAPAPVTFSANAVHAAADTTATFSAPGTYRFQVTITDDGGLSATSAVAVVVDPALTTLTVQPATVTLPAGTTQPFTAAGFDQFGAPFPLPPGLVWSATDGSIDSSGVYTAPPLAGGERVSAAAGSAAGIVSGSAAVTVTGTEPTGAFPPAQATPQDTPLVFSAATGNPITVTDAANPAGWVTVSLTARKGALTLARTDGISFGLGDGAGNLSMQFTGTVDAVNAALDGLEFIPFRGFSGSASIRISVSDPATPGAAPTVAGAVSVSVKPTPAAPLPGAAPVPQPSPFAPTPSASDRGSFSSPLPVLDLTGGGSSGSGGGSPANGPGQSDHSGRASPGGAPGSAGSPGSPGAPARGEGSAPPAEAQGPAGGRPGDKSQPQPEPAPKPTPRPPDAARRPAAPPAAASPARPAGASAAAPAPLPAAPAVLTGSSPMWHELDKMQQTLSQAEEHRFRVVAGTASFLSVGASVLYFAWILRAGSLLTSLLSSMPAWQFVDPLPILDQAASDLTGGDEGEEDDESLESMVEEVRRD